MVFNKKKLIVKIWICILFLSNLACKPYMIAYKHACIEEGPNIKIIKISTSSNNSRGESLKFPTIGLPLEVILENPNYNITLYTPLRDEPMVWLNLQPHSQNDLVLRGPNIKEVNINIPYQNIYYQYIFGIGIADGAPINFSVFTPEGKCIGTESIKYKIVSRGYAIGIETI